MFKTQTNLKIKKIRCDGGGEFNSDEFKMFLQEKGIIQSLTNPHSPQMNGIAERFNRTIMEKARCLLKGRNVDEELWAEAVLTANFIKNRVPTKILGNSTPEEIFSGKKPNSKVFKMLLHEQFKQTKTGRQVK